LLAVLAASGTAVGCSADSAASSNRIRRENRRAGSTGWLVPADGHKVADDAHNQVKGFATAASVEPGRTIGFKVTANPPTTITIDVYRLGYYGGTGARRVRRVAGVRAIAQPPCVDDGSVGLRSCANWRETYQLASGRDWLSGLYLAVFTADRYQSLAPFWITDDRRASDLLFVSSLSTYEAYNNYPFDALDQDTAAPPTGRSLYPYNSARGLPAQKVSFDRPFSSVLHGDGTGGVTDFEPFEIQWLERSGYDVTYTNDVHVDADTGRLLRHKAIVYGGHSEYWSKAMVDGADRARTHGVGLAFTTSNEVYWQVRYEQDRRVLVGYKHSAPDPATDPSLRTMLWREVGRPEQLLAGVQSVIEARVDWGGQPYVPSNTGHWAYAGTGLQDGKPVPGELVGYEVDGYDPSVGAPPGTEHTVLSASPFTTRSGAVVTTNSSIYRATGGNYVWSTGSMDWAWALAPGGSTDGAPSNERPQLQRMTKNILDRMIALGPGRPSA
jgi:hypothetical protein